MKLQRDLFPGALEMMILQSLQLRSMHGYALVHHIQERSEELLSVEEGSLYPALQRILKAELVESSWEISSKNRKIRVYRITAAGRIHLSRESSKFETMLKGVQLVMSH